jgi:hypothetical protein
MMRDVDKAVIEAARRLMKDLVRIAPRRQVYRFQREVDVTFSAEAWEYFEDVFAGLREAGTDEPSDDIECVGPVPIEHPAEAVVREMLEVLSTEDKEATDSFDDLSINVTDEHERTVTLLMEQADERLEKLKDIARRHGLEVE